MNFACALSIIGAALSFAGGLAGAYFGGYLPKKGENLATHQDIRKLTGQVAAVTTTTEEIKTEISDAAWNRQKRWELKREVLLEAAKRLTDLNYALLNLKVSPWGGPDVAAEMRKVWQTAADEFSKSIGLAGVICEEETHKAFHDLGMSFNRMSATYRDTHEDSVQKGLAEQSKLLANARAAIRKELGIEELE